MEVVRNRWPREIFETSRAQAPRRILVAAVSRFVMFVPKMGVRRRGVQIGCGPRATRSRVRTQDLCSMLSVAARHSIPACTTLEWRALGLSAISAASPSRHADSPIVLFCCSCWAPIRVRLMHPPRQRSAPAEGIDSRGASLNDGDRTIEMSVFVEVEVQVWSR